MRNNFRKCSIKVFIHIKNNKFNLNYINYQKMFQKYQNLIRVTNLKITLCYPRIFPDIFHFLPNKLNGKGAGRK